MLAVDGVTIGVGDVRAVEGISLEIHAGELVGLVGPKGAGKTSLLDCVSGARRPVAGRVVLGGKDITRLAPHRIAGLGVGRTFQDPALFPGLSVLENITLGRQAKVRSGVLAAAMYWGWAQRDEARNRDVVERIIDFLDLGSVRRTPVGALDYGAQKRVELGRALAVEPQLLLLDEPTAGVHVDEKDDVSRRIVELNKAMGVSVLYVSHDICRGMDLCDRVVALHRGRKIAEGPPAEIRQDPQVQSAYLDDTLVESGR